MLRRAGRHRPGPGRRLDPSRWTDEDRAARSWFSSEAGARGLAVEQDSAGNLWAWWPGPGEPDAGDVVATGSHLDTVRRGGAMTAPSGGQRAGRGGLADPRGVEPRRPVAVVAFADEEGGRFGMPTFGSRVLAGVLDPADLLERVDEDGISVSEALAAAGIAPAGFGSDPTRVGRLGSFVELHVEQGKGLVDLGQPVGLATAMAPRPLAAHPDR